MHMWSNILMKLIKVRNAGLWKSKSPID